VWVPGLWLYAENDQYWGPDAPRAWFKAFAAAGSPAQMVTTEALPPDNDGMPRDGHQLLRYGGKLWSARIDAFVRQLGR